MGKQTLKQRLDALKIRYAKAKRNHKEHDSIAHEMAFIMVKILKREIAQDKRLGR